MTNRIGNISIGSINNVNIGKSVNVDEYDILDNDINSVFVGEEEAHKIQIDFAVTKFDIISSVQLEEQKERIGRLVNREVSFNSFSYMDLILGFMSVSDVSFNESSDRKNIIEGSLSGLFLPWPKFFTQLSNPSSDINNYGSGFYGSDIYPGDIAIYGNGIYNDGLYK